MKHGIGVLAVLVLGMLVATGATNAPPAIKLVPLTNSVVSKKSLIVAVPSAPRLEIARGEPGHILVRVYGPPGGKYTLLGNCRFGDWQEVVKDFQMPANGAEGSFGLTPGYPLFFILRKDE